MMQQVMSQEIHIVGSSRTSLQWLGTALDENLTTVS